MATKTAATVDVSDLSEQITEVVEGLESLSVTELPDRETLVNLLRVTVSAVAKKKDYHLEQLKNIREQITGLRNILPEDTATRTKKQSNRGRPKGSTGKRNGQTLKDLALTAMKAAGRTGATKEEIVKAVLDSGFQTTADPDSFAGSVYVSGINKLLKEGIAEVASTEGRIKRYRVVRGGK